jgi:hypothetical protein
MIEWTTADSDSDIRCPYCVDNGNFRRMLRQTGGGWFLCGSCGHLALPSMPLYRCTCGKCAFLYGRIENQGPRRSLRSTLRRLLTPPWSRRSGSGNAEP